MAGSIDQSNKVIVREESFSFRVLARTDLPLLVIWRRDPVVMEWWSSPPKSVEAFEEHYAARIDGTKAIHGYVAEYDGEAMGYLQWYQLRDELEHPAVGIVPENASGLDLFIGDGRYRGRGFGPAMIRAFLRRIVFADESVGSCAIDPDVSNAAAISAYRRAGFRDVGVVANPTDGCESLVLVIEREELIGCGES